MFIAFNSLQGDVTGTHNNIMKEDKPPKADRAPIQEERPPALASIGCAAIATIFFLAFHIILNYFLIPLIQKAFGWL